MTDIGIKQPFRGDAHWIETDVRMPLVPLRGAVLFPGNLIPLQDLEELGGTDLRRAHAGGQRIGVVPAFVTGKDKEIEGLAAVGTEAIVTGITRLPTGQMAAMVKGIRRFVVRDVLTRGKRLMGKVDLALDLPTPLTKSHHAATRALKEAIVRVIKLNGALNLEATTLVAATDDPAVLCDLIVPHLSLSFDERVGVLKCFHLPERVRMVIRYLNREASILEMSSRIRSQAQEGLKENQKRAFLQEQIRTLKEELGELDGAATELEELEQDLEQLDLPDAVRDAVMTELDRMELMPPGSPEYMVSYTYVTWVRDLPWGDDNLPEPPSLKEAARLLDREHYGLEKVKERILEYLAVIHHRGVENGEVLLLAGPPGVGKTSLARSIAASLNRPFVRISLGGVKDEAEIRGHRRTYIGSMPGKILNAIKTAKTTAPVILLDEIDKVGLDHLGRGDLASALLEVLDHEQNKAFVDHYLGVPYDLSKVVFVATANDVDAISRPLLDRMEVVSLPSYTELEKLAIARRHLLPKIRKELGLSAKDLSLTTSTIKKIIRNYTREAGVRQLKRELTRIGRKVVRQVVEGEKPELVDRVGLVPFLGQPRYLEEPRDKALPPGVAIGLAYTSVGGDILYIESSRTPGDGKSSGLHLTGSLGKVMRESAQAALSYLSAMAAARPGYLPVDANDLLQSKIHLHFPDGATPKDGPSAGVAIMCAIASLFTGASLPSDLAMTGEITLRGQVLPVGGIREKILAAHRYGKRRVLLPKANWHDLAEIPKEILAELTLTPLETMEDALLATGILERIEAPQRKRRRFPTRDITIVPETRPTLLQ